MFKSIIRKLLIFLLIPVECSFARSLREVERRTGQVFSVTSSVTWTIFTPNPHLFSTTELYYLQKTASSFFDEKIKSAPEFNDQQVVLADFKLKDQAVEIGKVQSILKAEITMTYFGKVLDSFSDVLPLVIDNTEAENLLETFVLNGYFGQSSTSSSIKYEFDGNSSVIVNNGVDKYVIILIVLLSISSVLALFSFVILCVTKCCRRKRRALRDIKIKSTEDSDEPIKSPGVLGATFKSDGRCVITPQRGIHHQFEDTPMSQDSNATGVKSMYSTTSSKAPLGILSMNNLRKMLQTPEHLKHSTSLYNVGIDDEGYDNSDTNSPQP